MKKRVANLSASVRQRLLNLATERKEDFGLVLTRYMDWNGSSIASAFLRIEIHLSSRARCYCNYGRRRRIVQREISICACQTLEAKHAGSVTIAQDDNRAWCTASRVLDVSMPGINEIKRRQLPSAESREV